MKIGANKAFEVIGTKACLNLNADVGPKTINDGITGNYRRQRRHPIIRSNYAQRTARSLRDG